MNDHPDPVGTRPRLGGRSRSIERAPRAIGGRERERRAESGVALHLGEGPAGRTQREPQVPLPLLHACACLHDRLAPGDDRVIELRPNRLRARSDRRVFLRRARPAQRRDRFASRRESDGGGDPRLPPCFGIRRVQGPPGRELGGVARVTGPPRDCPCARRSSGRGRELGRDLLPRERDRGRHPRRRVNREIARHEVERHAQAPTARVRRRGHVAQPRRRIEPPEAGGERAVPGPRVPPQRAPPPPPAPPGSRESRAPRPRPRPRLRRRRARPPGGRLPGNRRSARPLGPLGERARDGVPQALAAGRPD